MTFKEILNTIKEFIYTSGWKVVGFFAILFFGIIAIRSVGKILKKIFLKSALGKTLCGLLASIIKFFLYLILLFVLASVIGIDLQPLTTLLLSAGLAISLALQDSLSNVANGIILASTKPFVVGDYVELGEVSGVVRKIGMFFTELLTFDNIKITVPNTKITSNTVINYSARPTRRVDIVVSVSRDSDLELVRKTLYNTLTSEKKALDEPPHMIKMARHTENSFDYHARIWVKTEDYWDAYWNLTEQIAIDFKKAGIKIPHKTVDLVLPDANNMASPIRFNTQKTNAQAQDNVSGNSNIQNSASDSIETQNEKEGK